MSNETVPAAAAAVPAKPKKKRRLLKFCVFSFIALIAFVLMLPTIISSGPGTGFVLSFVNKAIPGRIEIDDLSVGWFSGTRVDGLTIKDPDGKPFIVASLDAPEIKLLSVLRGNLALGTVTVDASQCDIIQYEDGTTNLDRTLGLLEEKPKDETPVQMPANLSARLRLTAKEITYSAPKMEKAIVSGLDVSADIDSPQAISAAIKAKVSQGANSGSIDGSAKLTDGFDKDGKMQMGKADVDATFTLANLPTAMIGALAKQGDKVTILAGPEVTTKIAAKGKLSDLTAELSVVAERLRIGTTTQIALSDDFKQQTIKPVNGQLAWVKITPEAHGAFTKDAGGAAGRLVEPFEVRVTHENIAITNGETGPDLLTATAGLSIAITPIRIDTGAAGESDIKELNISTMRVAYDGPRGVATALIEAVAKQGDKSGTFAVKVDLNKPFDAKGNIDYKTLDGTLDGQIREFALGVVDDLIGTQGLLTGVLGDKLNATALVKVKPTADGNGGSGTITLTANSAGKLDVVLKAGILANPIANPTPDGPAFAASASLSEPGTVKLIGAQRTLNALARSYPQLADLAAKLKADEASDITLTISELSAPLDASLAKNAIAKMAVNIGGASFDLNPQGQSHPDLLVRMTGVTAGLDYSGAKNQAVVTADIGTTVAGKPGRLTANVKVNNLMDGEGKVDATKLAPVITADVIDLPTALADAFIGKGRLAHYGIGPVLNAKVATTMTQVIGGDGKSNVEGPVRITAKAQNLDVVIDGRLRNNRFDLPEPGKSHVTMTATPALLEDLKKGTLTLPEEFKNLALDQPAKLHVTFTQFDLPLDGDEAKKTGRFGFTAAIDQIMPKGDDRLKGAAVRNLVATLNPTTLEQPVIVTLKGDLVQGATIGKIDATANVTGAMKDDRSIAANVSITNIPTALADAFIGKGRLAHYGIGPALTAKVVTTMTQVADSDGKSNVQGPVQLTAKAQNLDVVIDGRLRNNRFDLPEPGKSHVTMTATPALLEDLKKGTLTLPEEFKNLALDQPAKLHVTFTQFDLPLDGDEAKKTGRFGFTAAIDQIMPKGDDRLKGAAVRNLVATLSPTTLEQPVIVTLKGDLVQGATIGKIDATANITGAMKDDRSIAANVTITNIPTALVDALGGQGGLLVDLFGGSIERMALSIKPGEGKAMIAGYDIKSKLATGIGGITLVPDERATAQANSKLTVTLSPQGFATIQRRYGDKLPAMLKEVVLVEPTVVDVTIERAQFALAPLPVEPSPSSATTARPTQSAGSASPPVSAAAEPAKPLPINAKNSNFKVNIRTKGPFIGKRDFDSALRMENVSIDVHTPVNMKEITIDLKSETAVIPMAGNLPQLANAAAIQKGTITGQITAKNLEDKDGRVSFGGLGLDSLAVNVKGRKLPVPAVDKLLAMDGKLSGVLGGMVDELDVVSRKPGVAGGPSNELVARLVSPNADIHVSGLYSDRLSLTDNAVAKLHMNEILSSVLFEPMTGGILRAESSEKPVVIVVQKDGFSAPASGFNVADLNAKVDFDFNSMKLKPMISVNNLVPAEFKPLMAAAGVGGLLESELGEFLGKFDKYAPTFDKFSASIDNGTLRYSKPMTFKIDKYTVALDGTVNLKTKVPQLSFGFPKAALSGKLQKFLGSEGHLFVPFTQQNGQLVPDVNKFAQTTLKSAFSPANLIPGVVGGKDGGKPDLGGILGGILGGKDDKKMDDKKADDTKKPQPNPPTVPAPPTKTPEKPPTTPPPPAKTPAKAPTPPAVVPPKAPADPIKSEVDSIIALSKESDKKAVARLDEIAKTPQVSSVYILANAMHQLPGGKPTLFGPNTREPKWAAYEHLKRIISSSAFDKLCTNYLTAATLGQNTAGAHAAIMKWIKDNEAHFVWKKDRFAVEK